MGERKTVWQMLAGALGLVAFGRRAFERAASRPIGRSYSPDRPVSEIQTRIDKAIPPVWPSGVEAPLDTGFAIRFPAGTRVWEGEVASQGGWYMGGTPQIFIESPGAGEVVESWPLR